MSPEEWAKKIRDLIEEAEEDLDRIEDGEGYWLFGVAPIGGALQLGHFVSGRQVDSVAVFI